MTVEGTKSGRPDVTAWVIRDVDADIVLAFHAGEGTSSWAPLMGSLLTGVCTPDPETQEEIAGIGLSLDGEETGALSKGAATLDHGGHAYKLRVNSAYYTPDVDGGCGICSSYSVVRTQ